MSMKSASAQFHLKMLRNGMLQSVYVCVFHFEKNQFIFQSSTELHYLAVQQRNNIFHKKKINIHKNLTKIDFDLFYFIAQTDVFNLFQSLMQNCYFLLNFNARRNNLNHA